MKGGRKNWDEDETKTANDAPQEARNNRRTLLITGGKLGCRPTSTELQEAAATRDAYYLVGLLDDGGPPEQWQGHVIQNPIGKLLTLGQFDIQATLQAVVATIFDF